MAVVLRSIASTLSLTSDPDFPLPANTNVEAIDLNTTAIYPRDDFANSGPLSFSAALYDRIIIVIGAHDVDPASAIAITFNRPIDTIDLASNFRLLVTDIPATTWSDISSTATVTTDNGDRRVLLTLPSAMQRGKLYRVVVKKTVIEPPTNDQQNPPLKMAQLRNGAMLTDDLNFYFSTRAPAGDVATLTIPAGTVRDLAMNGNILFVSALEAGVSADDASDPAGLSSASPIATMAVPGAPGQIPAGEDWALATDDHDRIWATGLTSTFGVVLSDRVEDVVNGANTQAPPVIGEKATSIVSWRVGVDAGLPLSTDAVTISDRPEALPRKMRMVVQDGQPATFASMAALIAGYNGTGAVDIGGGFLKTTLQVDSARQSPYLLQRVTVRNLTRTFSWSVDVARNRTASITVIGQADDQFEVRHNYTTYGVVSLFGYGVGIFDLNAIDSNRAAANDSTLDPSYVPLNERVLMTRAEMNASCDPTVASGGVTCDPEAMANSGQHCPIPDLTFSPEAAIAASTETPSQLVVYGVEQNHGLVELRVRPAQSATEPATCSRANSLVVMERVPHNGTIDWFGHPRLNTLRNLFRTAAGGDPIARLATISTYTRTNATGATTMYGLVSAYEYGVLVVKLDPNGALNDDSLVDVVWIPSGATAVRVLNGQNVASVVDGKGRVLLIDLTQLDESARVPPHVGCPSFDCTSDLYPVTTGALTGTSAAPDEVGADDPRIVWKQKIDPHDPPLPFGTLAPLVDPDSGFIYTGNANGKDVRVTSAIDPHVHIQVSSGASDGHLVDAAAIVPLGIEPAANPAGTGAVFRLSVSLPGSITDSLATSSHELRFAVESEAVPGAPVAQSPAGFPRAHLRQADARGTVDPRAASSFTMQRLAPNASDADARKLRYQRGYHAWASPWIIAPAD